MHTGSRVTGGFFGLPYAALTLMAVDILAVLLAFVVAFGVRLAFPGVLVVRAYVDLLPFFLLFPCFFVFLRLYPGTLLHPAQELKAQFIGISAGFLVLGFLFFLLKASDAYSRLFFLLAWVFSLCFVPTMRLLVRKQFHDVAWWQTPVVLFASPAVVPQLAFEAMRVRYSGLHLAELCVPAFPGHHEVLPEKSEGIASDCSVSLFNVHCDLDAQFAQLKRQHKDALVVIHLESVPQAMQHALIETAGACFKNMILLPGRHWLPCLPAHIIYLGQSFGLVLHRNLADPRRLRMKRIIDVIFLSFFCLVGIPLGLLLALWIRLDSKGPILYKQQRVGREGVGFEVYKFRTMASNADDLLAEYLAKNPQAAAEWAQDRKLKKDPRITRAGHFLRKTSLDELPQLINIFRGEMSLVGPRPIVPEEVAKYGDAYLVYTRSLPGITGLWQVSGRNDTTYETRIALDKYYVNNWSVWLDIYIILRTIPVVLLQRGAY